MLHKLRLRVIWVVLKRFERGDLDSGKKKRCSGSGYATQLQYEGYNEPVSGSLLMSQMRRYRNFLARKSSDQ